MSNNIQQEKLQNLLGRTRDLVLQNEKLIKARKESFNLFSILNVERNEEHTHSAFIAELLNSEGSHLLGNRFLKLFLELIPTTIYPIDFNTENYEVIVEKHLGFINTEEGTGGRIDIYLLDKDGRSISIENKIDAGDQPQQLQRYCNHNIGKNTVLYLTLHGGKASTGSACNLEANKDYYCISYQDQIVEWLQLCLKEAADHPMLRESIKQYLILIKKLTNTLEMEEQKHLHHLMWSYLEESDFIYSSFEEILQDQRKKVRDAVMARLKEALPNYDIHQGAPVTYFASPIWLAPKGTEEQALWFGIESFGTGGHLSGELFIGIHDYGGTKPEVQFKNMIEHDLEKHNWKIATRMKHKNQPIIFGDIHYLKKTLNEDFYTALVDSIVEQALLYIKKHQQQLIEANENQETPVSR